MLVVVVLIGGWGYVPLVERLVVDGVHLDSTTSCGFAWLEKSSNNIRTGSSLSFNWYSGNCVPNNASILW